MVGEEGEMWLFSDRCITTRIFLSNKREIFTRDSVSGASIKTSLISWCTESRDTTTVRVSLPQLQLEDVNSVGLLCELMGMRNIRESSKTRIIEGKLSAFTEMFAVKQKRFISPSSRKESITGTSIFGKFQVGF